MADKPVLKIAKPSAKPATKAAPGPRPEDTPKTAAAQPARRRGRTRHRVILASFLLLVVIPAVIAGYYLFTVAVDQYHSRTAFSVRSEELANPLDALSAFTQTGASSASDSDILYDFITSQPLVERLDRELDLRAVFNRQPQDFVFSLSEDASIEDLMFYWRWMVSVSVDPSSGVVDVEVRAFSADDAQTVAAAILAASSDLVNDLSRIARDDKMKFAREDVQLAEARLKDIRLQVRKFRSENQIINPEADFESQMGVVSALQGQLAEALVQRETLESYAAEQDPRLKEIGRRVDAIRSQIADEREAIASAAPGASDRSLTEVIGAYEELLVDLEFSQNAYVVALAAEEQARAEARRQSRYLATHILPTLSQEPQYPQRELLLLLVTAMLFAAWSVMVLIYYNVRDRT